MPKVTTRAIPRDEFTSNISDLVHQLCLDLIRVKKEVDELKEEVRLSSLQLDAQSSCIKIQADTIETYKREENIWRERMRKALNYANFQKEMQIIKERDKDQPF